MDGGGRLMCHESDSSQTFWCRLRKQEVLCVCVCVHSVFSDATTASALNPLISDPHFRRLYILIKQLVPQLIIREPLISESWRPRLLRRGSTGLAAAQFAVSALRCCDIITLLVVRVYGCVC